MSRPYAVDRKGILIFFAILLLPGILLLGFSVMSEGVEPIDFERVDFDSMMQEQLVLGKAAGDKIVTYNISEDFYSTDYLPEEFSAATASDVGGMLYIKVHYTEAQYTGGVTRSREHINAALIDCKTGNTIAEKIFTAIVPTTTVGTGTDWVEADTVSAWVVEEWNNYRSEKKS